MLIKRGADIIAGLILAFFTEFLICNIILQPTDGTDTGLISFLLFIINTFLLLYVLANRFKDRRFNSITKTLILGFFFRIAIMLWDVYAQNIYILPNCDADALGYHQTAISYAFGGRMQSMDWSEYSFYIGRLYRFIGVSKLTLEFLHIFLAMWAILMIIEIMLRFNLDIKIIKIAVLFLSFLPNLAIITTTTLQEGIIAFGIVASIYLYTIWFQEKNALYLVLSVFPALAVAFLHMGGLVPIVGFALTLTFVNNTDRVFKINFSKVFLGLVILIIVLLLISSNGSTLLRKTGGELSSEAIVSSTTSPDEAGSADYLNIGIRGLPSSLDLIVNSPIRIIYFVFSPVPWMWRGINDILAFIGSTLFNIYVIALVIKVFKCGENHSAKKAYWFVLLAIIFVGILMFGWGVSNMGTAIRHREKFTYVFVLLFAFSKQLINDKQILQTKQNQISEVRNDT